MEEKTCDSSSSTLKPSQCAFPDTVMRLSLSSSQRQQQHQYSGLALLSTEGKSELFDLLLLALPCSAERAPAFQAHAVLYVRKNTRPANRRRPVHLASFFFARWKHQFSAMYCVFHRRSSILMLLSMSSSCQTVATAIGQRKEGNKGVLEGKL
jgi:hypothetical protein